MADFSLPVYMTEPYPLQVLIDVARSVRTGCYMAEAQDRVLLRSRLSEAQNHRCCWCARPFSDTIGASDAPSIEHVVPRAQGGANHPDNYAVSCRRCNTKRGVADPDTFMAHVAKVGWLHRPGS